MLLVEGVLEFGPARRGALAALVLLAVAPRAAAPAEFDEFPDDPSAWSTRIDARDFDERLATVADALEHAPGVDVRRFGGLGAYSTASVRGSKPEQVLVLLDGVRLDSGPRGGVDLSTIPLRAVETIEIVRGGAAGRYGSDAVGGVIRITSRRPDDEAALDASAASGELGTLGADALVSGGRGRVSGVAGYTRLSGDNDFRFERSFERVRGVPRRIRNLPPEEFTRRNAEFVQDSALARLLVDTGELSDLEATLELFDSERGQPGTLYGNPTYGIADEQVSCMHPSEDFRRVLAAADWGHASVARGALALSAFHRVEQSGLEDPGGLCRLVIGREGDRVEGTSAETGGEARWSSELLSLGPVGLRSRFAAGLRRDHARGDDTSSAERFTTNLFLLEEVRLLGGALRLFPSLGLDLAHAPGATVREPGTGAEIDASTDDGGEWLPKLGAIARLAPGLRLKANLERAFRRPSFRELYLPDFGYVRGNPRLEPEDGTNLDAGLEWRPPDVGPLADLSFEAVWFRAKLDESIEFVQYALTSAPENVGRSRSQGWELSAAATVLERLDLAASYTFTDSEIETRGPRVFGQPVDPPLPNRPRNRLFARAALRVGAGSAWVETRFEDEFTLQDTGWLALDRGVWQVDLGVSVALSKLPGMGRLPGGLELSSEWLNVGEAQRIDSLGLPLPGRVWYLRLRSRVGGARTE